jgi:hypothetical protein
MIEVEQAKTAYDAAMQAFDDAVERSIAACSRQAAVELGLRKGGLQHLDAIVAETDQQLAQAAVEVWQRREAVQAARDALQQAERDAAQAGQPTRWERQLALVQIHAPSLFQRYERDVQAVESAEGEAKDKARYVLEHTRQEILRYQPPAEVPA